MPSSIWQKKKQMTGQLENVKKSIFLGLRRVFFELGPIFSIS